MKIDICNLKSLQPSNVFPVELIGHLHKLSEKGILFSTGALNLLSRSKPEGVKGFIAPLYKHVYIDGLELKREHLPKAFALGKYPNGNKVIMLPKEYEDAKAAAQPPKEQLPAVVSGSKNVPALTLFGVNPQASTALVQQSMENVLKEGLDLLFRLKYESDPGKIITGLRYLCDFYPQLSHEQQLQLQAIVIDIFFRNIENANIRKEIFKTMEKIDVDLKFTNAASNFFMSESLNTRISALYELFACAESGQIGSYEQYFMFYLVLEDIKKEKSDAILKIILEKAASVLAQGVLKEKAVDSLINCLKFRLEKNSERNIDEIFTILCSMLKNNPQAAMPIYEDKISGTVISPFIMLIHAAMLEESNNQQIKSGSLSQIVNYLVGLPLNSAMRKFLTKTLIQAGEAAVSHIVAAFDQVKYSEKQEVIKLLDSLLSGEKVSSQSFIKVANLFGRFLDEERYIPWFMAAKCIHLKAFPELMRNKIYSKAFARLYEDFRDNEHLLGMMDANPVVFLPLIRKKIESLMSRAKQVASNAQFTEGNQKVQTAQAGISYNPLSYYYKIALKIISGLKTRSRELDKQAEEFIGGAFMLLMSDECAPQNKEYILEEFLSSLSYPGIHELHLRNIFDSIVKFTAARRNAFTKVEREIFFALSVNPNLSEYIAMGMFNSLFKRIIEIVYNLDSVSGDTMINYGQAIVTSEEAERMGLTRKEGKGIGNSGESIDLDNTQEGYMAETGSAIKTFYVNLDLATAARIDDRQELGRKAIIAVCSLYINAKGKEKESFRQFLFKRVLNDKKIPMDTKFEIVKRVVIQSEEDFKALLKGGARNKDDNPMSRAAMIWLAIKQKDVGMLKNYSAETLFFLVKVIDQEILENPKLKPNVKSAALKYLSLLKDSFGEKGRLKPGLLTKGAEARIQELLDFEAESAISEETIIIEEDFEA